MPIHSAATVAASVMTPMIVVGSVRPEPLMMVPAMLNSEKRDVAEHQRRERARADGVLGLVEQAHHRLRARRQHRRRTGAAATSE